MEIGGLPLHPLIVHATVVFLPLSAGTSGLFVLVRRWRWLFRWPALLLALVAIATAWAARLSGAALLEARPRLADTVATHQDRGELLSWVVLPYAIVVVLAALALPGDSPLASGAGARGTRWPPLARALPALTVVSALIVLVLVVLTGDSGSRAVWA